MPIDLNHLDKLERFFTTVELPKEIKLDSGTKILDVKKYINDTIATLKIPGLSEIVMNTRLKRLEKLKKVLTP